MALETGPRIYGCHPLTLAGIFHYIQIDNSIQATTMRWNDMRTGTGVEQPMGTEQHTKRL